MMAIGGAAATLRLPSQPLAAFAGEAIRPFKVPLRIPPVLQPIKRSGDREFYVTTMRKARARILQDKSTPVWAFDGQFPGPTIKATRGQEIVVRRHNRLDVPVTIHLHGGKVRPSSDGQPMDLIEPGDHKDYVYPNKQEAATLWYHDHTHHLTSRNNYMGLSGLYIIEDPDEAELNLPKGKYDIALVLQERSFRTDGSFKFYSHHSRVPGETTLVNGRPMPYLKVANRKYRFRILNAAHTRGYNLQLDSGEPLVQIGTDGGLMTQPTPVASLALWPAERAEVVIDFARYPVGTKVVLSALRDPLDPGSARPVMRFDVEREETDDSSLPLLLRPVDRLIPGTVQRDFELSFDLDRRLWVINGKRFDPNRIDARPKLGATEVWTFRNNSTRTHPMHIHLVRFQVLDRSNKNLDANDLGWKDTVRVDPASTVRVAVKFEGYTGRYMFHCHNLAHEDHSMMGQMKVVRA